MKGSKRPVREISLFSHRKIEIPWEIEVPKLALIIKDLVPTYPIKFLWNDLL
jgi:hypothetical protein